MGRPQRCPPARLPTLPVRSIDVTPKLHEDADTMTDRLGVEHKLMLRCSGEQEVAARCCEHVL